MNWMRAREGRFGSADDELLHPVLDESGSDSAMLDNALELLVRGGRDIHHAITMLVPPVWYGDEEMEPAVRDFYRYHSGLIEPWDGPAGLVFTDGRVVGAALDRNGLRPLRFAVCEDGLVVCSSEAGAVDLAGRGAVRRGKLGPGQLLSVDPDAGRRARRRDQAPPRRAPAVRRRGSPTGSSSGRPASRSRLPEEDLTPRQALFGYTREELMQIFRPIASHAHEPTYSMGDDSALTPLANRARPLFAYFRQRFAQVTNPPIDHLRERYVFSLRTLLGDRSPILVEGPEAAHGVELESFFLFPDALAHLGFTRLDATFAPGRDPRGRRARGSPTPAEAAVRGGGGMLLVTDEAAGADAAADPDPARRRRTVHQRLVATGLRTFATLLVESDEPREVHHFACLLGYGAEAICPRLALETLASMAAADKIGGDHPSPPEAQVRFKTAIEDGVLKVMSKMGISDVASYCGAQLFEAIGLAQEVVDVGVPRHPVPDRRHRVRRARAGRPRAASTPRSGGSPSSRTPATSSSARAASCTRRTPTSSTRRTSSRPRTRFGGRCATTAAALYEQVRRARQRPRADGAPRPARARPRGRARAARRGRAGGRRSSRRFSSGAMSHGALSAEAHELVAIALNRLGGKANSGEGGEDPARFGTERNCAHQAGRLGPLRRHARVRRLARTSSRSRSRRARSRAREASCPAHKVSEEIARLRHTQPGVALISPPPHHDIYSIEDLAQLIFDLKQVNPRADVSVKLVSEAGVGLVAAGVREGARGRRPHRRRRRRHRREPALVDQERRRAVGARPRRDAAGARRERPARPRARARRRRLQDRPRRRRRRAARRRRGQLRHRAPARRGLPDGADVPPRHLPGRDRDAEARAAGEVRGDARAWSRRTSSSSRRRCASCSRRLGLRTLRRGRRPRRPAAPQACRRRAGRAERCSTSSRCSRTSARGRRPHVRYVGRRPLEPDAAHELGDRLAHGRRGPRSSGRATSRSPTRSRTATARSAPRSAARSVDRFGADAAARAGCGRRFAGHGRPELRRVPRRRRRARR